MESPVTNLPPCPACSAPTLWLGQTGRLAWLRCSGCGRPWYAEEVPEPAVRRGGGRVKDAPPVGTVFC